MSRRRPARRDCRFGAEDRRELGRLGSRLHDIHRQARRLLDRYGEELDPAVHERLERVAGEPAPDTSAGFADLIHRLDTAMAEAEDALRLQHRLR